MPESDPLSVVLDDGQGQVEVGAVLSSLVVGVGRPRRLERPERGRRDVEADVAPDLEGNKSIRCR